MLKILLVEDDNTIALGLEFALRQEGYSVTLCQDMAAGAKALREQKFDLCLFDLTLPDGSGYELCRTARERWDIPILILTACDDEVNVVMGLELGADDYITKPFRLRELQARIKTVLRRYRKDTGARNIIELEHIRINTMDAKVYKHGQEVILTALEYRLLLTFANNEGRVLSRNQLLEGIWDVAGDFVNDNTLTVYIKRLRDKLEESGAWDIRLGIDVIRIWTVMKYRNAGWCEEKASLQSELQFNYYKLCCCPSSQGAAEWRLVCCETNIIEICYLQWPGSQLPAALPPSLSIPLPEAACC
jgi:two-component system response regulator VicR